MVDKTLHATKLEIKPESKNSKVFNIFIILVGLIIFGIGGFLLGLKFKGQINESKNKPIILLLPSPSPSTEKTNPIATYIVKKETSQTKDPNSYKYSLISKTGKVIYSIVNWNGFGYAVSDDNKYISVMNYSEAMGDETLTLINSDGKILKEFGHLESTQTLVPFYWTEHYYWVSMGIPIGDPAGVIRINADNLKFDKYLLSQ